MPSTIYAGDELAQFVARTTWDDLSPGLRHEAKRSILNLMGCCLGAAHEPTVASAARVLQATTGSGVATVYGRPERLDVLSASFLNAVSGNFLDYDDTHLPTVIHPSAPVAPPVLARAELLGRNGRDVLLAFLVGGEVECRLGNAVSPAHYARGWHITTTCGVFGSAAGSAKLSGLDQQKIWHALGIAASASAGVVQNLPNEAKNVSVGNAARNGLQSALFADAGYNAAPDAIEGRLGWASASGDDYDQNQLLTDLGSRWEIGRNTYKPYPAGIVMHAVIDACLEIRALVGPVLADIDSVSVAGDSLLLARGDRGEVHGERDAKVSIHHCAAAALVFGKAGVEEFALPCVQDPRSAGIRARVHAELDDDMPVGAARVQVVMRDGTSHEATVIEPVGSLSRPMSDDELVVKFRSQAALNPNPGDVGALIDALWALDEPGAMAEVLSASRGL